MDKYTFKKFLQESLDKKLKQLTEASIDLECVDTEKEAMDCLMINYFGFLGLFKLRSNRAFKTYDENEGSLWIDSVSHVDNSDISFSVKKAVENRVLKDDVAHKMLLILKQIKNKVIVKKEDLTVDSIRHLLDEIDYIIHPCSPEIQTLIMKFHNHGLEIGALANELFQLSKTEQHQPYTKEFRKIVADGQYSRIFKQF